jgi:hypothetical protein
VVEVGRHHLVVEAGDVGGVRRGEATGPVAPRHHLPQPDAVDEDVAGPVAVEVAGQRLRAGAPVLLVGEGHGRAAEGVVGVPDLDRAEAPDEGHAVPRPGVGDEHGVVDLDALGDPDLEDVGRAPLLVHRPEQARGGVVGEAAAEPEDVGGRPAGEVADDRLVALAEVGRGRRPGEGAVAPAPPHLVGPVGVVPEHVVVAVAVEVAGHRGPPGADLHALGPHLGEEGPLRLAPRQPARLAATAAIAVPRTTSRRIASSPTCSSGGRPPARPRCRPGPASTTAGSGSGDASRDRPPIVAGSSRSTAGRPGEGDPASPPWWRGLDDWRRVTVRQVPATCLYGERCWPGAGPAPNPTNPPRRSPRAAGCGGGRRTRSPLPRPHRAE